MAKAFSTLLLAFATLLVAWQPAWAQTAAAGQRHTAVVRPDGHVWAWGGNSYGQLGDGTVADKKTPVEVAGITTAIAVAAGATHTLVLLSNGTVWAFGYNGYGQLGDGTNLTRTSPVQITGIPSIVAIAAGELFSVALANDGTVRTWGANFNGQLGDGTTVAKNSPVLLSTPTGVTAIAAGGNHTVAVKSGGTVWAWGLNSTGQLGDGTTTQRTTAVQMTGVTGASSVAAGAAHSLVLKTDGTLRAVGQNAYGQLGDGTTTQRTTSVAVLSVTGATVVSADQYSSYARKSDGTAGAWGSNGSGQLGDGTTTNRSTATQTQVVTSAVVVAGGEQHAVAVSSTGVVWTWGSNGFGQLGDGTNAGRSTPGAISEANYAWKVGTPVFDVAGGTYYTEKTVTVTSVTSGVEIHYTLNGNTPTLSDATVSNGGTVQISQTATLKAKAFLTGVPSSEVGSATYTLKVAFVTFSPGPASYTTPKTVTLSTTSPGATIRYTTDDSTPTEASPLYSSALSISTTTILKATGFRTGWTPSDWNGGTYQMNFGTLSAPQFSQAPGTFTSQVTVALTAMAGATIRYTTDGSNVGGSSPIYSGPIAVTATSTIKAAAFHPDYTTSAQASGTFTIVVATPTLSLASGTYPAGQVVTATSATPGAVLRYTLNNATPTATDPVVPAGGLVLGTFTLKVGAWKTGATPSAIASATYVVTGSSTNPSVAGGDSHSLGVRSDGVLWAWGANSSSQLGDGTSTQRTTPTVINGVTGAVAVSAGSLHSLAVRSDGSVLAWGSNGSGQLGDGTTISRSQPVMVTSLGAVTSVAAGGNHSLALKSDRTVWAWGESGNGVLGDGTNTQRNSPVQSSGLSGITRISTGLSHALALKDDGSVWSWGKNANGQLGTGNLTSRWTAGPVPGLGTVTGLASGADHTVVVLGDGTVKSWGYNVDGRLGDGTTTQRTSPVSVTGLTNVIAVATGASHSLAVTNAGVVYGWGNNASGQIGDGTTVNRNVPVVVSALPAIIAIAAGGSHSLAIAADGSVWAWGKNANAQLGDGSTTNRLLPVQIANLGNWTIPQPTLSLASGTFNTDQTVTVNESDPTAVMHYTLTGVDPTEGDPIVNAGASLTVSVNTTLKVRAWKAGGLMSPLAIGAYEFKSIAPAFSPNAGTYAGAQSVALSTSTPGATLTYTTDGSDPTSSSTGYASPVAVATSQTLKARAFKNGWTASDIASAAYTIQPPCSYSVTPMTINVGAGGGGGTMTITTNSGCAWTASSAQAWASLDSSSGTGSGTVSYSIASNTGATRSGSFTMAGQLVGVNQAAPLPNAPSISQVSPTRAGVGANLTILGADFGAQQNDSIVTINGTPVTVNTWSAGSISLTVPSNASSGPVVVTVNGVASNGVQFDFVLGRRQTRQATYISPDEIRVAVGESRPLKLVDQEGQEVTGATWTVSDDNLAEVSDAEHSSPDPAPGDPPRPFRVFGLAVGRVTVTAVSALGTAQAEVTIYAVGGVVGSTNTGWQVYADTVYGGFIEAVPGQPNNPGDPDYYLAEAVDVGGYGIRALDAVGSQLWRKFFPQDQDLSSLVALADGGLLARVGSNLVRLSPDGATLWLQSAPDFQISGVGYDDTIYGWSGTTAVVRDGATGAVRYVVANAVPTGTFTIRYNPLSTHPFADPMGCAPYNSETPPAPYSLNSNRVGGFVGGNGHYYFAYQKQTAVFTSDTACATNPAFIPMVGKYSVATDVSVVELLPDAAGATVFASQEAQTYGANSGTGAGSGYESGDAALCHWGSGYPCWLTTFATGPDRIPGVQLGRMVPDGAGGILVTRSVQATSGAEVDRLVRVVGSAAQYDVPVPGSSGARADMAVGDNGLVLFSNGAVTAIDPTTGVLSWEYTNTNGPTSLLSTTEDGGAIAMTRDGSNWSSTSFQRVDAAGVAVGSPVAVTGDLDAENVSYVSDGTLLISPFMDGSVQVINVAPLTPNPGSKLSNVFGGIFKMFGIQGRVTKEHVETAEGESAGATGYDRDGGPAVMVPANGSNKIEIAVEAGETVTLMPANDGPTTVMVSPASVTGTAGFSQVVTLTGGATPGTTYIKFIGANGKEVGKRLQVDVKKRVTVALNYFRIIDNTIVPNPVDRVALQTQLNQILLRQANIEFAVVDGGDFAFHYDTTPTDQKMASTSLYLQNPELNALRSAFFQTHPVGFRNDVTNSALMNVFYVKEIANPNVGGFAQSGVPLYPAVVRSTWPAGTTPAGYVENLTAHEVGHVLGRRGHHAGDNPFMMSETNNGSVKLRLSRLDWNLVNP